MEGFVYILSTLTALACTFLLLRGYARSGTRLLLWCGIFFLAMSLENGILFYDRVIVPEIDLAILRQCVVLLGVTLLLYGLIWDVN